jgi:hypothetical protein
MFFSSNTVSNRTRIFAIGENDWSEKTGNVSFFVEISAFNQNYSVWKGQTHYSRHKYWRWRRSEHRFNLTILKEPEYEVAWRSSHFFCNSGWVRTLIARKNCETILSENITIDHLGQITVLLGDFFSFPDNFEKMFNDGESEFNSIFKMGLTANPFHKLNYTIEMVSYTASKIIGVKRGKEIGEMSIKELAGSTFKEFKDSNRYITNIKKTPHILVFKIIFENPW